MKKSRLLAFALILAGIGLSLSWAVSSGNGSERELRNKVDTRIDNEHYWEKMAEQGYIEFNPDIKAPLGIYTGSKIEAFGVLTDDSPDIPVTEINSTQSENSIFADPNDASIVLNSNNSTQNPVGSLYGANDFFTFDGGETWEGEVQGAGGSNSGDPTTAIGLNGRWYVNYIDNPGGMGVSYSDNQGSSWTTKTVVPNPGDLADKNHMWIDNSATSPYEGNVYISWTNFGGPNSTEIGISTSTDNGETWTANHNISSAVNAGSHNQGVNIGTGPDGEVYAIWAIYDGWPTDESAIGMSKSFDGGATWETATRVITNIRGIRTTETSKNMRVNSFPVCAVDNSNGPDRGSIYITWANIGEPGVNTGSDIDVYVAKSTDQGETWSDPIRVNQDEAGLGKEHYFPWIACDASNGALSIIFYDDRNVSSNQAEVFCANSFDGGETWEDFKVSDVSFTPSPIPGLAGGYFGDYLGITAQDGWVYPVWPDTRTGSAMTYCSPYETNPLNRPNNLVASVAFETGACDLTWTYEEGENFLNFKIYRDGEFLAETTDLTYTDMLPDYGYYTYQVSAFYTENMESGATSTSTQWGDAHISVDPLSLSEQLLIDSMSTKQITVINTGQLDLEYSISAFTIEDKRDILDYCAAQGGGDEYIKKVVFGDISNSSVSSQYADYTDLSTTVSVGDSYSIVVTNGNPYSADQCGAWIDWDQNGEFDDGMISFSGSPGNGPYTAMITPPQGAKSGATRMRIRVMYTGTLQPCGTTDYGEVEDYTVNVQGWFQISDSEGTIAPGDTSIIDVIFDAHDMEVGNYEAAAIFTANDPIAEETVVEISLAVKSMLVEASTDSEAICFGGDAMLSATFFGTADTVIYSWTSVPEGIVSDTSELIVTPEVSTWYFIEISDTVGNTANDSVFVEVYDLPLVSIGADTTFCGDIVWILDAGNEGSQFSWSTGDTSQTIEIDTVGFGYGIRDIFVDVTNENGCVSSDTIQLEFVDCTAIEELVNTVDVTVYPNPSNGVYQLKLNTKENITVDIMVFSSNGQQVYRKSDTKLIGEQIIKIDISKYAKGVYQLIIQGEKGVINKQLVAN